MSDLRRVLHSALSYVRSQEETKSLSSVTLDHLIDYQIRRLQPSTETQQTDAQGTSSRKSRFDRLEDLEAQIKQAVSTIEGAGSDPDKLDSIGLNEES